MAAGVHHWKHGWIPLDATALAEKTHGHPPVHARATLVASTLLAKVGTVEPGITSELRNHAANVAGGQMVNLPFRLKSRESLARKLQTKAEQRGTTPELEARRVGDVLRYTMTFPPQRYTAGVRHAVADLTSHGYRVTLENNWPKGIDYKGINGTVLTPGGQTFELQFHTPASFAAKEAQHADYEVMRDPRQPATARRAAYDRMAHNWNNVAVPAAVASVGQVVAPKAVIL